MEIRWLVKKDLKKYEYGARIATMGVVGAWQGLGLGHETSYQLL